MKGARLRKSPLHRLSPRPSLLTRRSGRRTGRRSGRRTGRRSGRRPTRRPCRRTARRITRALALAVARVVLQVASAVAPFDETCFSVSEVTFARLTIEGHMADADKALVVV